MSNIYACLARNSMPNLASNLYRVYYDFMEEGDELLIIENDSTDHTKLFLEDFSKKNGVSLITEDLNLPSFGSIVNLERANNLAKCRNKYLKYAKERNCFEYLIVFDSDMHDLPVENFSSMFTKHAAVTSNGLLTQRVRLQNGQIGMQSIFYDSWAYQGLTDDTIFVGGDFTESRTTYYTPQPKFPESETFLEVRSCFGGLGVYRMDAIKDCWYHPYEFNGKKAALGEQGGFTEDIRKNGGKVFINTKYQPIVNAA